MKDKKKLMISITVILIIVVLVCGATVAFLYSRTNESDAGADTGKLDISYSITPKSITGNLLPTASRSDGLVATAVAKLNAGSVSGAFNIYITPTSIDGLNIDALIWEVEGVNNGSVVYTNSGNFSTATKDTPIKIVNAYNLLTTDTTFTIYIWLQGSKLTTAIDNKTFSAKISADSVNVTGTF